LGGNSAPTRKTERIKMKWPSRNRTTSTGFMKRGGRLTPRIKKVKNGRLFKVENTARKFGAKAFYAFTILEDSDGKNETPYLFTTHQLEEAKIRAEKNPEDLLKKDRLTDWFD